MQGEKGEAIKDANGEVLFDVGSGAQCEQCHMPGRHYMGIDYRPDHSFRIPRPDLSSHLGTPNACNRCHFNKSYQWSQEYMVKWYGTKQRPHYGSILAAGREHQPEVLDELVQLAGDRLYPAIARATALDQLAAYRGEKSSLAFILALTDEEAIMRQTAVRRMNEPDPWKMLSLLAPLLYDPVKAVRIEAALRLTVLPSEMIAGDLRVKFDGVLAEYRKAAEHTGDFAASRHNLGNMYANLGQTEQAVEHYRKAIEIDDLFYPAKVNLAGVYNRMGRNSEAEVLLRAVVEQHPNLPQIKYSLALLLAEEKKYEDAEVYLMAAVSDMPHHARARYNLGLLQQRLGRDRLAEASLMSAVNLEPDNFDYLYALADFYLKRGRWERAQEIAQKMIERHPDQKMGHDIVDFVKRQK
jgi:tetratricopeptide (TPR) repeat protein